jgi:hypothetical protein
LRKTRRSVQIARTIPKGAKLTAILAGFEKFGLLKVVEFNVICPSLTHKERPTPAILPWHQSCFLVD